MGIREKCDVCEGYTNAIYNAFIVGEECPDCGACYEIIRKLR
jgi:hypothetical protein